MKCLAPVLGALAAQGWTVLRAWETDILDDTEAVVGRVVATVAELRRLIGDDR